MIVLELFTIFLIITIVLLILGIFRKQYILFMLSGIFFLILGYFVASGVEYKVGTTMTIISGSVTEFTNIYQAWDDWIKYPMVSIFSLLGLFFITISWMKILGKNIGLELVEDEYFEEEN